MIIGAKINNLIKEHNITQETLASNLGVSQKAIHDIISGKTQKIDFLFMHKLCDFFDVDFNFFIEKPKLKQINKDSSTGYLADSQNFNLSEKLIEQYEERIKELKETIAELKSKK
ncbi:helix-turn-helix domain-containing protein [Flavobacterium sp.]|uniref:helix-turn-helix domain-containing protein n=1 Tax=Flavobacterium sp. TaxID=239 RepID=UPI0040473657